MTEDERRKYRETMGELEAKKAKFKLLTIGGTLITTAAIAFEIFGAPLIRPKDAGYFFTSDNVTVTQGNPDDYMTKSYSVVDSSGNHLTFTFNDLEEIEPNVNPGYTFLNQNNYENLPEDSNLGIQRDEDNSNKTVYHVVGFSSAFAGLGTVLTMNEGIKKIDDEKYELHSSRKK